MLHQGRMKSKISKRIGIIILIGVIVTGGIITYMWFKPHRNIQATKAFAELKVSELINEFNSNVAVANAKYLAADGNSIVLIVEGRVSKILTNLSGETVLVLQEQGEKVGVSATFSKQVNNHLAGIKKGDIIKVKGAITAGNSYDAELDLYEHATLIKCDIVK